MEKFVLVSFVCGALYFFLMCFYFNYFSKLGKLDSIKKKVKAAILWLVYCVIIVFEILIPMKAISFFNLELDKLYGVSPFVLATSLAIFFSRKKLQTLIEIYK